MTDGKEGEPERKTGVEAGRPATPVARPVFLKEWGRGGCGLKRLVFLERCYSHKKAHRSGLLCGIRYIEPLYIVFLHYGLGANSELCLSI